MNQIFERGRIVKGKVTGIKKYGIFVIFENGYKGLIHISEISDYYINDINTYANIGEIIPCKILAIDTQTKEAKLTLKNLDYEYRRARHFNKNFNILNKNLSYWIEEKIKEIKRNNKK